LLTSLASAKLISGRRLQHLPRKETDMVNGNAKSDHPTVYFVNGEQQTTDQDKLAVAQIVEAAGFTPASDYTLRSENPARTFQHPDEVVEIHPQQRFQALFTGLTPVS